MNILYTDNKNFITYSKLNSTKKKAPCIIFHHGLMSDMNGNKALYIEQYCKKEDLNFIRFDNFGHGNASGIFSEQNISSWLKGLNCIINSLTTGAVLLIGSSMGAWITMLQTINHPTNIIGMIGIASAPDFTEELIWNKLTKTEQNNLMKNGLVEVRGEDSSCKHSYPISSQLIIDGRKHLLLNKENIKIK